MRAFPDFHETLEDIIAEGDNMWIRFIVMGTHTSEVCGIAPTGKKITVEVVDVFRMVDGKVVEDWEAADGVDFYKKLGVIDCKGFPNQSALLLL